MNISCIVVDHDLTACQHLIGLLKQLPNIEVVGSFSDPRIALQVISEKKPDMVFLEMEMPMMTGFEILDSMRKAGIETKVIIVTEFENYSIEGIRKEVFDYLIKPVSLKNLTDMVFRYMGNHFVQDGTADSVFSKLRFNTIQGFFLIETSDIVYIKADGNYSIIYLNDGTNKLITLNLGNIAERLTGMNFFRIDRSLIINVKYLSHINKKEQTCTMSFNGASLAFLVNRARVKQLGELFF